MFGMIHKAARDVVVDRLGVDAWEDVAAASALGERDLLTAEPVDDAVSSRLIAEVARRLGVETDVALEAIGRAWVAGTSASPYARLLDMVGDDLETCFANLDRLHASVKAGMPAARPPSFTLLETGDDGLRVRYVSERPGLAPFARGLIAALADRFGEPVLVRERPHADGVDFELRRAASPRAA